jgi:hypothetical protein
VIRVPYQEVRFGPRELTDDELLQRAAEMTRVIDEARKRLDAASGPPVERKVLGQIANPSPFF